MAFLGFDFKAFIHGLRGKEPSAEDEAAGANGNPAPDPAEGTAAGTDGGPAPELYSEEEIEAVEAHISDYFGPFEQVYHELVSPDIHVDICVIPPHDRHNYYTLVTMGMGAHRMNVPEELAKHRLERAELVICLPVGWELENLEDETWYWPLRLLKRLARLPGAADTWLGWGHTVDNQDPYAENTALCGAILTGPQGVAEGAGTALLPGGEAVNFYQVLPIYREEMAFKLANEAEALLDRMAGLGFVVDPRRPNCCEDGDDRDDTVMDGADPHLESLREKHLPVDELAAYNHLTIYLRWCIEHDLMSANFLGRYGWLSERLKADPQGVDLRAFLRDVLHGLLSRGYFNREGAAFARYYYGGDEGNPYYPADVDRHALEYFGEERYHSDEFQDEAYLFLPFDEAYYQAMARTLERRWDQWKASGAEG